jgi:hypothetical protein
MVGRIWRLLPALILVFSLGRSFKANAGSIPCPAVIAEVHRRTRLGSGKTPDVSEVAKGLHTEIFWVEQCMRVYGLRPRGKSLENKEGREEYFERLEEEEPEEKAAEEIDAGERLNRDERDDKPRQLRPKKTPTPGGFKDLDW